MRLDNHTEITIQSISKLQLLANTRLADGRTDDLTQDFGPHKQSGSWHPLFSIGVM